MSGQSFPNANHMQHALRLAQTQLGNTGTRPAVGCMIVKDGHIVGTGATGSDGKPHAEQGALEAAGSNAAGADVYVTLEPCAHHGQTPPCAEALVKAGVARVAIGCKDPDQRVRGMGEQKLRDAGIEVATGVLETECAYQLAGYLRRQRAGLPWVTMKLATSLDNKIATATGRSEWITGDQARLHGHQLRATHDAILTGIGTVLSDNPSLTCRLPGLEHQSPIRVILDSELRIPLDAEVLTTSQHTPTWILTHQPQDPSKVKHVRSLGAEVFMIRTTSHLRDVLALLAAEGVMRVLIEAGNQLSTAFLRALMVDELYWYRAPKIIGDDGLSAMDILGTDTPDSAILGSCIHEQALGKDHLQVYSLPSCLPGL